MSPKAFYQEKLNSCAIVSSGSFMNNSNLGDEIDSHDAVLRFNNAPVKGFENDVGTKTTIRLVNSQVLSDFNGSNTDAIYTDPDVTLLIWRAGPYNGNLYRWYNDRTGQRFFSKYIEWQLTHSRSRTYLINPNPLWRAWDIIQENTPKALKKSSLSSGFVGIMAMMHLCDKVDVYGFVTEGTPACHYYDDMLHMRTKKGKLRCSSATWHPIDEERAIARLMNIGPKTDIAKHGKITLKGYRNVTCEHIKNIPSRQPRNPPGRRPVYRRPPIRRPIPVRRAPVRHL
ncbi:beta-galactoside alpha-2,6-sialyltransferase 1-like [Glandiceps talaboti]